jgi:hypothetical protein
VNTAAREIPVWQPPSRNRRADLLAAVGLFAVVFVTHAGSLNDGLFFDDHWHRATLSELGWSFNDLVEAATFDLPGNLANLWWQEQPLQWRYARPVAMLFMKIELILSGGSPVGVHVCALIWHSLTSVLVYLLAAWAIGHRGWGFLAAVTFAIQPHSVFGVSWIAARNALVSGFFFLAAMYVYASACVVKREQAASLSIGRLLLVLVLWGLALFSRETAIVFPVLVLVLDLVRGGWRLLARRVPVYVVIWFLTGAYLYWRLLVFPVAGPPSIYFTAPSGAAYVAWAASKLLHMLFALVFQTPMFLGLATYDASMSSQAAVYGVMVALLAVMAVWYVLTSRPVRTRWFWPCWVVATFVPVIPVFIMPHFAYLPAAAFAVMLGVMLRGLRGFWRPAATVFVLAATLWSFGVYRYLWRGILRSEQLICADIRASTPRPEPGCKLFFVNMPVAGIYTTVALREAWGLEDLEGYVLTFAPHPLVMGRPCVVERIGDRELLLSIDDPGYFSGLSGRMLRDGMRPDSPLAAGTCVAGELFDTTVLEGDETGIRKLKFTFHRPLDSPDFRFYLSSPERPAGRLRFDTPAGEIAGPAAELFELAHSGAAEQREQARKRILALAGPLAEQLGDPIQTELRGRESIADQALPRVMAWWRSVDASRLLDESAAWREAHATWLRERRHYFQIAEFTSRIVRSDLLLTGAEEE